MNLAHQLHRIIHLRNVLEELVQESIRRYLCHDMGTIFQGFDLWRGIGYPSHIGRIRLHIHIERWLELAQFIRKSQHTLSTAIDHTRTSLHMIALGKDLREIANHTIGNATMLLFTQLCQLTTIALGILPHLRQPSLHFLAQRS